MTAIQSLTDLPRRDYLARDYDSLLATMRVLILEHYPDWTDYQNEADLGNVLLELFAHWGDIFSYYTDRLANESLLGAAQTRRSIIQHLKLVGYSPATATPATTQLTLTFPAHCQQESITISQGAAFATIEQHDQSPIRFEYLGKDLPINCQRKQYVGLPVTEGHLIKDEVIGIATGKSNQRFPLGHRNLILRTHSDIELTVGETLWTLRNSLAFSRNQQTDFIIEIDEDNLATVIFGDGNFGAIPSAGETIQATYRVGGGTYGNVAAGAIQTIVTPPNLSRLGITVTNPRPAIDGAQRESNATAILRASTQFQQQQRTIATIDYQTIAQAFPGVGKVRATATSWNTVVLYLAPVGGASVDDLLKANLLAYLEEQRPVTTTIEIAEVDYVKIYVTAEIGIKTYYDPLKVKAQVQRTAGQLLAFDNVDFGQTLYLSKFYEAIEATEGVSYVTITEFRRELPSTVLDFESALSDNLVTTHFTVRSQTPTETVIAHAIAEITIADDTDKESVHSQIRTQTQRLPVLTPPLDIGQLSQYLQLFYQNIQALDEVETVNVLAPEYSVESTAQEISNDNICLTSEHATTWLPIAAHGKIELTVKELPKIPSDIYDHARYQDGIHVVILEDI